MRRGGASQYGVIPAKAGIQYAATSMVEPQRFWNTGSPALAGDGAAAGASPVMPVFPKHHRRPRQGSQASLTKGIFTHAASADGRVDFPAHPPNTPKKRRKDGQNDQSSGEDTMPTSRRTLLKNSAAAAAVATLDWTRAQAQAETVRIGVIYDLTGPFAAGGSVASAVGTQIAIDLVNEKGGVGGKYKIAPVNADSQSKPDVAINEASRLIDQEKVDIIDGIFASSHAVPLAAKVEQQKKILWITTAVSTAVFKDKNLQYVFRAQIHSDQYGQAFAGFLAEHAKAKLGMDPKDVKVALIHEDGPYGVGVAAADEAFAKEAGLQVVLKEGYSASAPDLSVLVTKLKRAKADVISHAGYNPDITLLLRQARESGLKFKMLFGAGAGYSQLDKLRATFGADIDNFCNIDPVPAQLLDPAKLAPGVGDLTKIMVTRYKEKTGATDVPPHCSMGFNQTWILLNNVLPVAKEKYGGFDPDAIRKAALDVDIPAGGTIQGYGVKFYRPGTQLSGQNERSTPVVMQNAGEHISVVWPTNIKTQDPVFPLPKSSVYAA
jgi:branched-chain amino acid transport system substrate-binding protein